jgi:cytochrome b6-f complex iron-sulfur subunit
VIVVLPPDVEPQELNELVRKVESLGWKAEVSRADEQVVVSLAGSGDAAALKAALEERFEADVIPILSSTEARLVRSRRKLLTGLATGLGLLTAAGAGLPVVGYLLPPSGSLADPESVSGGSAERLEAGTARSVVFHGMPVLLICLEPGRYVALSAICTHMQVCRLEWDGGRRQLLCPCHGACFDIHGNVVRGPASVPLSTYEVDRIGDELFVRRS